METVQDVEKWLTERKLDKLVKIFQGLFNIYTFLLLIICTIWIAWHK